MKPKLDSTTVLTLLFCHVSFLVIANYCWFVMLPAIYPSKGPVNHFLGWWVGPGEVERIEATKAELEERQANPKKGEGFGKVCKYCKLIKAERTHHCKLCGTCWPRMDHHCMWLATCVGRDNHRFFLLFLLSFSVSAVYVLLRTAPLLKSIQNFGSLGRYSFGSQVAGLSVASLLYCLYRMGEQIPQAVQNITSVEKEFARTLWKEKKERYVNPYDSGVVANLVEVFFPSSFAKTRTS
ncbi:putative DHHC zinc finger domain protein [Blattamonas nauphoetae]|uniref:Palmitoyltransferase n=1 Tax=Blattamonas nauphoetae TaxID=2049346 RepID=A0ABQ9XEW6_9EUKA|nr:putative DHHC zinc finger domain protein [Blattamonas nauphoetae]